MSRRKNRSGPSRGRDRSSIEPGTKDGSNKSSTQHASISAIIREVIESIVIAFVLAFLFRTFEAEAFVIPTGSMAPTLMGRHKDLSCEECGYPFRVSASDEIDSHTNRPTGKHVVACVCPNCRHTMHLNPDSNGKTHRSYKGDRILVGKFPYRFADPERWDVAVFKYPGGASTNFIKRIVGLPGETIRISHGDLFTRRNEEDGWEIARKSLAKVRAMMQTVYDNDYVRDEIVKGTWPARWSPRTASPGDTTSGWVVSEDHNSFETDGSTPSETWLGYRHLLPSSKAWPELITDFSAYNTDIVSPDSPPLHPGKMGLHWVGDLAVECQIEVKGETGEAVLELVEGGWRFGCRIDVASGAATLSIDGLDGFRPTAKTSVSKPGSYRVFFANVDDQLLLSINGREVSFDSPTTYDSLNNTRYTDDDLEPVWIGSNGAAIKISHLKVCRDIYYIAERSNGAYFSNGPIADRSYAEFPLAEGQFLVLGDNSAESKDSRLWEAEGIKHYVSRELLIGKALVIYWPHSLDRIPGTNIPIRFFPNFWRMWFVR